ncbi:MAG: hypothetical protein R3C19_27210, partial [Planctomycetaceae bacterium]
LRVRLTPVAGWTPAVDGAGQNSRGGIGRNVVDHGSVALPECSHRTGVAESVVYHCSHSLVRAARGMVTAEICGLCSVRELPSQPVSRDGKTRRPPRLWKQAWNVTQAVASFLADGCRTLDEDAYRRRLEICEDCEQRQGNRCMSCGCQLLVKARGRAFQCPLGKWPD